MRFTLDKTAPTLTGTVLKTDDKTLEITLSEAVLMKADLATLKSDIQIAKDGSTYEALAGADTVEIRGDKLIITFNSALTTATNKVKIAADALKDAAGNTIAQIETGAIDATTN